MAKNLVGEKKDINFAMDCGIIHMISRNLDAGMVEW